MNLSSVQVLLVEDDRDLAASVADYLNLEQIIVDHAYNGQSGFNLASENHYDVILLDLMLPRMDGLTVCEKLRNSGIDTPILMLTARDALDDKVAGFRAGTDDYLIKPFAMEELIMRIQALAKRRSGQIKKLAIGTLEIDLNSRTALRSGQIIKLSPTGWLILETLMRASPKVVSRKQLEDVLWPEDLPDSNSLKVHMFNVRQQVDKPFDQPLIHTVQHQGFVIKAEEQSE